MSAVTPAAGWRNRITGAGEEAPDQLLANLSAVVMAPSQELTDEWISTSEVARLLAMSRGFVRARITEGSLPATAIEVRRLIYRIRRSDFEAWRRAHSGPATSARFQR